MVRGRGKGTDQLLLHGRSTGGPQLVDHLAIQVDAGGAHVLPGLGKTQGIRHAPSSKRLPGPSSSTWRHQDLPPTHSMGLSRPNRHRGREERRPPVGLTWGWHPSHQSPGLELHPLFPARAPAHLKGALVPSEQMSPLPGPILHPLGNLITKKAPFVRTN